MGKLPADIKLTRHAQQRLEERNNTDNCYNTKNIMRSSCKWYSKDDLIINSKLYLHCLYVCRKSNQMGYITDGNIEVIYNKNTGIAITILEVKDKFKPITQYIKPHVLEEIKRKKEGKKMRKAMKLIIGTCPDCGKEEIELMGEGKYEGLCHKCKVRIQNANHRGKEYVPYVNLSKEDQAKIDMRQEVQKRTFEKRKEEENETKEIPIPKIEIADNYYQVKAENNPAIAHITEKPIDVLVEKVPPLPVKKPVLDPDPLSDQNSFITTLRSCGCEIPEDNLKEVLDVLVATDKLKDVFMTIAKSDSQDAILDLEQALNVVERKLQHDWEYNGFQEADDIRFKGFLTWRRVLKGAIFFWKKLYQTNALIEIQRAWNAYTADPNEKILLAGDRINSIMKRWQITTTSISTIFNTKKPFTRVFYASSKEEAYKQFTKWMSDRQLHEDPNKTTIVELTSDGKDE